MQKTQSQQHSICVPNKDSVDHRTSGRREMGTTTGGMAVDDIKVEAAPDDKDDRGQICEPK